MVGAANGVPNPDTPLIALCASWHANIEERDRIYNRYAAIRGTWTYTDAENARLDELLHTRGQLEHEIAALQAGTPQGFAAKAMVLLDDIDLDEDGQPVEIHALRHSLLQDLLRAVQS